MFGDLRVEVLVSYKKICVFDVLDLKERVKIYAFFLQRNDWASNKHVVCIDEIQELCFWTKIVQDISYWRRKCRKSLYVSTVCTAFHILLIYLLCEIKFQALDLQLKNH